MLTIEQSSDCLRQKPFKEFYLDKLKRSFVAITLVPELMDHV